MGKLLLSLFLLPAVCICGCSFKFEEEFRPPRYEVYQQSGATENPVLDDTIIILSTVASGSSGSFTLILKCTGKAWLTVDSIVVADAASSEFSIGEVTGVGTQLDENQQATAVVNFEPTSAGNKTCTVVIQSNAVEYETRSITVNWTAI